MKTANSTTTLLAFLAIAIMLLTVDTCVSAPSDESSSFLYNDLFNKVFDKTLDHQQVLAPFFFNEENTSSGEIMIFIPADTDTPIRFIASPIIKKAQERVAEESILPIMHSISNNGTLSIDTLKNAGWDVIFDHKNVLLRIIIPPNERIITTHNMQSRDKGPDAIGAQESSTTSAYANVHLAERYYHHNNDTSGNKRQPLNINIDGIANWNKWVLEGDVTYMESGGAKWSRGPFHIVKDYPENMLRMTIGDLTFPTQGFQQSQSLGGIGITKNFDIQPHFLAHPIGSKEIFLEHPSTVEIWINNQLYKSLDLPAGRHDFQDLPAKAGINDFQFKVIDNVGRETVFAIPFIFARSLLAPGLSQYNHSLGIHSNTDGDGKRHYSLSDMTLSHFYRRGLTNNITVGEYFQGNRDQILLGIEGISSTSYGTIGFDSAISSILKGHSGITLQCFLTGYPPIQKDKKQQRIVSWSSSATFRSRRFAHLGTLTPDNNTAFTINGSVGSTLFYGISGKVGAEYRILSKKVQNPYNISANFSRSWKSRINTSLNFNFSVDENSHSEHRVSFNFLWYFSEYRQSTNINHDFDKNITRATWRYKSPQSATPFNATVGVEHRPNDDNTSNAATTGAISYSWYRATLKASHSIPDIFDNKNKSQHISQVSLGTAIIYTGGHFGISRPMSDSFIMVSKDKSLKEYTIGVNPSKSKGYQAKADMFGPAIISAVPNYQSQTICVDTSTLPLGLDIGPSSYKVMPLYKSGFHIKLKRRSFVVISGMLTNTKGTPIELQAGNLIPNEETTLSSLPFFTNRKGKFEIMGIIPGEYTIQLIKEGWEPTALNIPKKAFGLYDAGTITINMDS